MSFIFVEDASGTYTDFTAFVIVRGRMGHIKDWSTDNDLVGGLVDCIRKAGIELKDKWYEHGRTAIAVANVYVCRKSKDSIGQLDDRLHQIRLKRSFQLIASNGADARNTYSKSKEHVHLSFRCLGRH